MKKIGICLSGLLWSFLVLGSPAAAKPAIPEELTQYAVLISLETGYAASGFYLHDEQGQAFVVTVKHNLFESKEGQSVLRAPKALLMSHRKEDGAVKRIFVELNLEELQKNRKIFTHPEQDVAAIKIGELQEENGRKSLVFSPGVIQKAAAGEEVHGGILGASPDVIKRYQDVAVGNEIFILGYPVSLGIESYPQIDYSQPLLRAGVVAGKNDAKQTIILDCPTQYGNSGGPVIEVEQTSLTEKNFWVAGVVTEFIPFDERWYTKKRISAKNIENSGYSVAIPMDTVLDLIAGGQESF